ncbi:putative nuclease HARBI1 [Cucumis melo var. makuwa]|uniref:Nuclease HARBI1 n=1 Tax=Cucumis melo var. makuwa TaxID=1194695 RepID=A0A5D3CPT9_CUCMM|nr:putative nuclease HARBI1 [Cucumis melo var. makuwa]TYK13565.1 putative nuclease HARBI1 [Cucumis melo var. makuwa]
MKHSSARNVIERAFGVLKGRWVILRGNSYYPVEVQCRTILTCCLLHKLINREMPNFDIENDIDESHPAAKGLLNKSFPYYDELSYMLGKNRATESQAETFTDVELNDPTGYEEFAADAAPDMDF